MLYCTLYNRKNPFTVLLGMAGGACICQAGSKRLAWEHVVPAEAFGQSFPEWREGHPACVDSKGKAFKGRNCARKMATQFRYMEADLYNLTFPISAFGLCSCGFLVHPL